MSYEDAYDKMEQWLAFLEKRNRKELTLRSYRSIIRNLIGFLNAEKRECDPERIGEDDILFFIRNYIATENTIRQYVTILGMFTAWWKNPVLSGMGLLWNDSGHPNAKWVEDYEVRKMLANCKDPTERIIITLAARCGCRRDELARLKDTDYDGRDLRITGKGHGDGKVRIMPLTENIRTELESYIRWKTVAMEGRIDRSEGHLLILPVGKRYVNTMKMNRVALTVKEVAARSGVACTTHSLRRFFATNMASRTKITNVQTLMGHSNINTTQKYIKRNMDELRKAMESADDSI